MSGYWAQIKAASGVPHDFYMVTRHHAVHYMHAELGLEPRVIAAQCGWTLGATLALLGVHGHGDVGALEAIDRAFAANVTPLRAVGE